MNVVYQWRRNFVPLMSYEAFLDPTFSIICNEFNDKVLVVIAW